MRQGVRQGVLIVVGVVFVVVIIFIDLLDSFLFSFCFFFWVFAALVKWCYCRNNLSFLVGFLFLFLLFFYLSERNATYIDMALRPVVIGYASSKLQL